MRILKYISIIFLLVALAVFLRSTFSDYQEFGGKAFNTYYKIKIRTSVADKSLPEQVAKILQDVDAKMSVFREDSEISRLNRAKAGEDFALSDDLSKVLKTAKRINKESNGAFDPAIAPLIDLWGFGPGHEFRAPSKQELSAVKAYSDFKKLKFSKDYKNVIKKDGRTSLNLSAIAKGYAVDKVAESLDNLGFRDYIVEIGGELRLSGKRDEEGGLWNIGIGVPLKHYKGNALVMEISDYAVATSGDYRNFIEEDGKVFSHRISPQTGQPVKNDLASVTVFAPTCMEADAYATAIMAMGKQKGLELANKIKLPIILFTHNPKGGFDMESSKQAQQLIGLEHGND